MIIFNYASKKELKAAIGRPLNYIETSVLGLNTRPMDC